MRLHHGHCWWLTAALFFFLGLWPSPGAQAKGFTGGLEIVIKYTGPYRGIVDLIGPGQSVYFPMAAKIKGSHKKGGLNAIEFAENLTGKKIPSNLIPKDLDRDNPDPHKAAALFNKAGITGMILTAKLVPKAAFGKDNPKWTETLEYESKILVEVKRTRAKNNNLGEWTATEKKLDTCISDILKLRRSDIAFFTGRAIEKTWKGAKVVFDEEKYPHDPDRKGNILAINMDKTIKTSGSNGASITRNEIKVAINGYGAELKKGDQAPFRHQEVVKGYVKLQGDIKKACDE